MDIAISNVAEEQQPSIDSSRGCLMKFSQPRQRVVEIADASAALTLLERLRGRGRERGAGSAALWRLRHSVSESNKRHDLGVSHDTAVPLHRGRIW